MRASVWELVEVVGRSIVSGGNSISTVELRGENCYLSRDLMRELVESSLENRL